jgi:hypothetical protein
VPPLDAPAPLDPLARLRAVPDRQTGTGLPPQPLKIGIWGAPQSGKTTFLAALQAAIANSQPSLGKWGLTPLGAQNSAKLLEEWTDRLLSERLFPEATKVAATLSWRFEGNLAGSRFQPSWRRLWRADESAGFDLDLIDVSGEVFRPPTSPSRRLVVTKEEVDQTLQHLADAQGLIFLFDPVRSPEARNVQQFLNGPLTEVKRLVAQQGRMVSGRLPHYICVCVTKFDDPRVFERACLTGYVNSGRDGIPRVRDRHARRLFEALCDGTFWPPDELGIPGSDYARRLLQSSFLPARTRYYVTSAIGFKRTRDDQFDHDDWANVVTDNGGERIRNMIRPINVLEPLVELQMKLRQGRGVR